MSTNIVWSNYAQAYKALFDAVQSIAGISTDLTRHEFMWNPDGTLATLKAYKGENLLYTLSFAWNPDGTLESISRS